MVLGMHVRGVCLSAAKTSYLGVRRLSSIGRAHKAMIGKHIFLQANSSVIRGNCSDAEMLMKLAMPLLQDSQSYLLHSGSALYSTVLLLQNKPKLSKKWHSHASSMNSSHGKERKTTAYSLMVLHDAIRHVITTNDIRTALSYLSNALTSHLIKEDHSPLKYSIWSLSIWLYFVYGRGNKSHELLQSLPRRDREHWLMNVWTLEFQGMVSIIKGDFGKARKTLAALKHAQKGRMGSVFHSCLVGILATCKKDHLGIDTDTRDDCINSVIYSLQKLVQGPSVQVLPVAIVLLFLCAHSAVAILSGLKQIIGLRKGGGVRFRLVRCVESAVEHLTRTAAVIPPVALFVQALEMKLDVVLHREKPEDTKSVRRFPSVPPQEYEHFQLGLAFWYTERAQYCEYFETKCCDRYLAEIEACRSNSKALWESFGMPPNHVMLGSLGRLMNSISL